MWRSKFSVRIDVIFDVDGKKVIDSRPARLLLLIDKYGSHWVYEESNKKAQIQELRINRVREK